MKLSMLLGKKTENAEGRTGYVIGVYATGRQITHLHCADSDELEFFIPVHNITSVKNKIMYTDGTDCGTGECVRLGKPVFDCAGKYIGRLCDYTVEKFVLTQAVVGNKKFAADETVCGDAVIIKDSVRFLKSDVKLGGRVFIKKGTPVTKQIADKAISAKVYVQTKLKTL